MVAALPTNLRLASKPCFGVRSQGFTLLEILVVIVIVGVIISITTISMGVLGRDREMQEEAERIWAVLQQAKEECELQGFDVGLRVGASHYDFLRFDARRQQWLPIGDDDLMDPRSLPPGLRMRLWLEGREVILTDRDSPGHDDAATTTADVEDAKDVVAAAQGTGPDTKADAKPDAQKELPPQIMVLSSGDLNSFDLRFEREGTNAHWRVLSRPDNTVVAEQADEQI